MSRDTALTTAAGQLRRAAEMVCHAEAQLVDVSFDKVALQLLDIRLALEELRLDLIESAYHFGPAPRRPPAPRGPEQLPF